MAAFLTFFAFLARHPVPVATIDFSEAFFAGFAVVMASFVAQKGESTYLTI